MGSLFVISPIVLVATFSSLTGVVAAVYLAVRLQSRR